MNDSAKAKAGTVEQIDAVILGAGFSGLCMLHKLRNDRGLNARIYDKAGGVGGTWYWNRYPGARSDTESFVYSYSFDPKLYDEWEWSDRYPKQPEILSYLEHVADRYDLRRSIVFNTAVTAAHFNEDTNRWDIETDTGERVSARWIVTGLGLLSAPNVPNIPGLESFKGETYHTSRWPHEPVDFSGKRVGVIGTGSTGVQLVTEVGPKAGHLTVFQRRAQYSVPARHGPLPKEEVQRIKSDLDRYFNEVLRSGTCFGFPESSTPTMSVSPEERERVYEDAWEKGGGFRFMFGTFSYIAMPTRRRPSSCARRSGRSSRIRRRRIYSRRPISMRVARSAMPDISRPTTATMSTSWTSASIRSSRSPRRVSVQKRASSSSTS
jgi:cyclohexanone monooxygenase